MKRKSAFNFGKFEPLADALGGNPWGHAPIPRRQARRSVPRYRARPRPPARLSRATLRGVRRAAKPGLHWHVVDNLPDLVPVARRELEVIETYLAVLLDDSLKGNRNGDGEPSMKAGKHSKM